MCKLFVRWIKMTETPGVEKTAGSLRKPTENILAGHREIFQ